MRQYQWLNTRIDEQYLNLKLAILKDQVRKTINKLRENKASGADGNTTKKAVGEGGVDMMHHMVGRDLARRLGRVCIYHPTQERRHQCPLPR